MRLGSLAPSDVDGGTAHEESYRFPSGELSVRSFGGSIVSFSMQVAALEIPGYEARVAKNLFPDQAEEERQLLGSLEEAQATYERARREDQAEAKAALLLALRRFAAA